MNDPYWNPATGCWTYYDELEKEYFVWIELHGVYAYRPVLDRDVRVHLEARRKYKWFNPNPREFVYNERLFVNSQYYCMQPMPQPFHLKGSSTPEPVQVQFLL
jgi:hypothetical protein